MRRLYEVKLSCRQQSERIVGHRRDGRSGLNQHHFEIERHFARFPVMLRASGFSSGELSRHCLDDSPRLGRISESWSMFSVWLSLPSAFQVDDPCALPRLDRRGLSLR